MEAMQNLGDVDGLAADELLHELKIRGVVMASSEPAESLRAVLRPLVRMEGINQSITYPATQLDADAELQALDSKIKGLELVYAATDTVDGDALERLRSRFFHVLRRINKLQLDQLSPELLKMRSTLLVRVLSQIDQLDAFCGNFVAGTVQTGQAVPSTSANNNSLFHSTHIGQSSSRSYPVAKWQLKFDGDPRGMSVHSFLERAEELRLARGLSERQLYDAAIDLFDNKALLWFRSNRARFNDWHTLKDLLIKHYEPPDYRARLFEDILNRTQDPRESFVDYFSAMQSMFRRHGAIGDQMQLDIISRNLAPFYTMQLPTVRSLLELENECLKLEQKKHRADHYKPPTRKRANYVEPDLACVHVKSPASSVDDPIELSINATHAVSAVSARNASTVRCFNCDKLGHLFRECSAPKRVFCYRCGELGTTSRNCSRCSRSLNSRGGS